MTETGQPLNLQNPPPHPQTLEEAHRVITHLCQVIHELKDE